MEAANRNVPVKQKSNTVAAVIIANKSENITQNVSGRKLIHEKSEFQNCCTLTFGTKKYGVLV